MKKQKSLLIPEINPEIQCCSLILADDTFRVKGGEIHSLVRLTFYKGVLRIKERIWRTYKHPSRLHKNKDMMAVLTIDAVNTYRLMKSTGVDSGDALLGFLAAEFSQPIHPSLREMAVYLIQNDISFERMLFAS